MARINSGIKTPRGRVSSQVRTTKRTGNIYRQKKKITIEERKKLKRKKINKEINWLW